MAITTHPTLATYFHLSGGYEILSNETHPIPASSPYRSQLDQIPQGKAGITLFADNEYDDATIATVLTVEVNDGTDASPNWTSRTATDTTPSSGEVYVELADYAYSSWLVFHSSDAGKACRVSYVGWGSPVDAEHLMRIVDHLARLEAFVPCRVYSEGAYHRGWFSPEGEELSDNTTRLYVAPSGFAIQLDDESLAWAGGWAEFGSSGNCEIDSFTHANYYRKVRLYLYNNSGTLTLAHVEGSEAATAGGATAPDAPSTNVLLLGIITVQNDGTTGSAGHVNAIAQADVASLLTLAYGTQETMGGGMTPFVFRTFGTPVATEMLDNVLTIPAACEISQIDLYAGDSGTSGDDLVMDVQVNEGSSWVSLFDSVGDQPTITANSGDDQTDVTLPADMDFSSLTSTANEIAAGSMLKVIVDSTNAGVEHVTCTVWGNFLS